MTIKVISGTVNDGKDVHSKGAVLSLGADEEKRLVGLGYAEFISESNPGQEVRIPKTPPLSQNEDEINENGKQEPGPNTSYPVEETKNKKSRNK